MLSTRLILALFLVAQAYDGVFTYAAIHADGLAAEGNVLLGTWMALVGPAPALVGAKLLAAGCGILLYMVGFYRGLAYLTAFYAVAAIGPWLVILQHY
jgi:hypothetical protein